MKNWVQALHQWCLHWAETKWGTWALFLCAFTDATIFPLPTPMLFLTLALLNLANAYKYALFATLGIFTGAIAGYAIGHFAWLTSGGGFTDLAQFMFDNIPGFSTGAYDTIRIQFEKWDFGILFIASFMPLPYNVFSISSGVFDVNPFIFCCTTLISQGVRFYLFAFLIIKLGPEVKKIIRKRLKSIVIIASVCIALVVLFTPVFSFFSK